MFVVKQNITKSCLEIILPIKISIVQPDYFVVNDNIK